MTSDDSPAPAGERVDTAQRLIRRSFFDAALEREFGVCYRGEVCKRSFDGWRQIWLCNAAKGEIFTRRPVR